MFKKTRQLIWVGTKMSNTKDGRWICALKSNSSIILLRCIGHIGSCQVLKGTQTSLIRITEVPNKSIYGREEGDHVKDPGYLLKRLFQDPAAHFQSYMANVETSRDFSVTAIDERPIFARRRRPMRREAFRSVVRRLRPCRTFFQPRKWSECALGARVALYLNRVRVGLWICSKFEFYVGRKLVERWLEVSVNVGAIVDVQRSMI